MPPEEKPFLTEEERKNIENAIDARKAEAQKNALFKKIYLVAKTFGKPETNGGYMFFHPGSRVVFRYDPNEHENSASHLGIVTCYIRSCDMSVVRYCYREVHSSDIQCDYSSHVSRYIPGEWEMVLDSLYWEVLKKQEQTEKEKLLAVEQERRRQADEELRKRAAEFGIDC